MRFSYTLYHELGHHIHETQRPEYRERENVADTYAFRLLRRYWLRRWYVLLLTGIGWVVSPRIWRGLFRAVRMAISGSRRSTSYPEVDRNGSGPRSRRRDKKRKKLRK
jgi:hypothetical protein